MIVNIKTVLRDHQLGHLQGHKLVVFWGDKGSRVKHHFFFGKGRSTHVRILMRLSRYFQKKIQQVFFVGNERHLEKG